MKKYLIDDIMLEIVGTRPKEFDGDSVMRINMVGALRQFSDDVVSEYNKTTRYWKSNRPVFTRTIDTNLGGKKNKVEVTVYTDNEIYKMIDNGTPAHEIVVPEKSFQTGSGSKEAPTMAQGTWGVFRAGSLPGTLSVGTKGSSGKQSVKGAYLSLNQNGGVIHHPGIRARDFTGQIADKMVEGNKLQKRFQSVLDKAKFFKGKETQYG